MTLTIKEIVMKLVGPVSAIGDSAVDVNRFKNLKALIQLHDALTREISEESACYDSNYASIARSGKTAKEYLSSLTEWIPGEEADSPEYLSTEYVEDYIRRLSFSDEVSDYTKTLVIGNIRGFVSHLRGELTANT